MDHFFNMLLDDLRDSIRQFNRLVWTGLLFVVVCYAYVVEPYFRYHTQAGAISRNLLLQSDSASQAEKDLAQLKPITESIGHTLATVHKQIDDYPNHLRDRLPEIRSALWQTANPSPVQQGNPQARVGMFTMPSDIKNFEDGVRWYVNTWFRNLTLTLDTGVVKPASTLNPGIASSNMKSEAENALGKIQHFLNNVDPEFWRSYGQGKVPVAQELQQLLKQFFDPIEQKIQLSLSQTSARLEELKAKLTKLQADRESLVSQEKELKERLSSLESPLGKLPLDLTDLIVLFPLLIAGFITMLAAKMTRTERLRGTLSSEEFAEPNSNNKTLFDLCTECWFLPPYLKRGRRALLVALFVVLIVLGIRGSWLAWDGRKETAFFGTESKVVLSSVFFVMNAASAVLAIVSLSSIGRILLRHNLITLPSKAKD